jgi:hypothetical protein
MLFDHLLRLQSSKRLVYLAACANTSCLSCFAISRVVVKSELFHAIICMKFFNIIVNNLLELYMVISNWLSTRITCT